MLQVQSSWIELLVQDFKVANRALGLQHLVQVSFWPKVEAGFLDCLGTYLISPVLLLILQKDEVSALQAVRGEVSILWVYVGQGLLAAEAERLIRDEVVHSLFHNLAWRQLGKSSHLSAPIRCSCLFSFEACSAVSFSRR